jgi:hypothetical protein
VLGNIWTVTTPYANMSVSNNVVIGNNLLVYGNVTAYSYTAVSDYRVKANVLLLDGKYTVDNLKPVSYVNTLSRNNDIGFLAHEIQEHYPELVIGQKDGEEYQSLNYTGLIGILTKELQELKRRVDILESKNKDST